jgi:hypothetical protein
MNEDGRKHHRHFHSIFRYAANANADTDDYDCCLPRTDMYCSSVLCLEFDNIFCKRSAAVSSMRRIENSRRPGVTLWGNADLFMVEMRALPVFFRD